MENFSFIKKFLRLVPLKSKITFIMLGLSTSIIYALQFYLPLLQKNFVDTSINNKNIFNESLYNLILYTLFLLISKYAICLIDGLFHNKIHKSMIAYFYEKILRLKKQIIKKRGVGYYFDCLVNDLEQSIYIFDLSFFYLVFSIIQTICIFFIIWSWSPFIAIIFLLALIFSAITSIFSSKYEKKLWQKIRESVGQVSSHAIDSFSNNTSIKFFQAITRFRDKFKEKYEVQFKISNKNAYRVSISTTILFAISSISLLLVLIYSLELLIKQKMSYGEMIAIISYYQFMSNPVDNFFNVVSVYFNTSVSMQRILNIHNLSEENLISYKDTATPKIKSILLKDITISYQEEETKEKTTVLNHADIEILNKQKIGLVGLSGEGKSSLLKLLEKDDSILSTGNIYINKDYELKNIPSDYYYSKINILSQEIEIFNADLKFNLHMGKKAIKPNEKDEVLKQINNDFANLINLFQQITKSNNEKSILDKIKKIIHDNKFSKYLPTLAAYNLLYDTRNEQNYLEHLQNNLKDSKIEELKNFYFDTEFYFENELEEIIKLLNLEKLLNRNLGENGSFISGGEKQKIVLGRFLLRKNYDFFIIDEPLTNLDAKNEKEILDVIASNVKDKTGIIISHRFNILRKIADSFYVIKDGKIKEKGKHEKLLSEKGLYWELFETFKKSLEI